MTLENSNQRSPLGEDLSVWDFSETFSAEEVLSLILGVSNHHFKSWEEKKAPFERMETAFEGARKQILQANLDADIPFDGDPKYEISKFDPLHLHSQLDQEARKNPTSRNMQLAIDENFQGARFCRQEIGRWVRAINCRSIYSFSVSEQLPKSAMDDRQSELNKRAETTYLNIIGGLLDLMLGTTPGGQKGSAYESQTAIISALLAHHEGKPGIADSTLEQKFAAAKRSIKAT